MGSETGVNTTKAFPRYKDLEIASGKHSIKCFCSLSYLQSKMNIKAVA